jgi:hypothetical protein
MVFSIEFSRFPVGIFFDGLKSAAAILSVPTTLRNVVVCVFRRIEIRCFYILVPSALLGLRGLHFDGLKSVATILSVPTALRNVAPKSEEGTLSHSLFNNNRQVYYILMGCHLEV